MAEMPVPSRVGYCCMKSSARINPASPVGKHERFARGFRAGGLAPVGIARRFFRPNPAQPALDRGWNLRSTRLGKQALGIRALEERNMIRKLFVAAVLATFAVGSAMAQESCESKAMGKDGKPLAGAAKTSFMKKCMADSCAPKAVSADGKPLSGAAKNSFMAKCEKGA